jgi:hypothetical protein
MARTNATGDASARLTREQRTIRHAVTDGTLSKADARRIRKAGLDRPGIRELRYAITKPSDGSRFLTRAEVYAILRDDPRPDPTTNGAARIKAAAADGRLTDAEAANLRERGITTVQLDRLRTLLRENGGKPITTAQALAVYTGKGGDVVDPPPPTNTDLVGPTPMSAVNADGYRLASFPSAGGGSGQTDAAGNLYVPVGNKLRIFDANNTPTAVATLPFNAVDVAPGPNGDYIYAIDGRTPRRLLRGADGNYTVDPSFQLQPYPYGGTNHAPQAYRIATDHQGNLFVADGMWSDNMIHTVVKYDAAGKYQTRFGEYADGNKEDAASWEQGRFYWGLGGIAVSPDGSSVYTTEVGNSRVQKWDAQADGSYRSTLMWGNTQADDPDRVGLEQPGRFAAPYDIGLDGQGNVYVMNTTVAQIQKFTADGQYLTSMYMGDDPDVRPQGLVGHSLAVTARGDAVSVETGRMMQRA